MPPRIAIAKSRVYKGGVFQVIAHLVHVCNELGVTPDIVTMKTNIGATEVTRDYGESVQLNFRKVLPNLRLPYEWHFLYFNCLARPALRDYDLIINSSNTSLLGGAKGKTISYVHYPRKDRVVAKTRDLHVPEGPNKSPFDIGSDPLFVARWLHQRDRGSHSGETVVANSFFTRSALLRNYALEERDVAVVYPPVDVPGSVETTGKDQSLVATFGRFSPEKRQLEQIEIAARLPVLRFTIMGFGGNRRYFDACEELVRTRGIRNVKLQANLPLRDAREILERSAFFLHTVRNEPFGITSAQAIAAGSIPVVHDSGGQREVVPIERLRYRTVGDAAHILQRLSSESSDHAQLRRDLVANVRRFSAAEFRGRMKPIIERFLS